MNELYNLRRKVRGLPEKDPTEGPIYPNVLDQAHLETGNVSQDENVNNSLLNLFRVTQALKGGEQIQPDRGSNVLLNPRPSEAKVPSLLYSSPQETTLERASLLPPSIPRQEVSPNAVRNIVTQAPTVVPQKPANALLDYWAQPAVGKMPLDQFVQIAGGLSHAFAPQEPMGRAGGFLSQIGGAAYAARVAREEEMRREEAKPPTEWGAFYKEHMNTINPTTGKTYTIGETLKEFHQLSEKPKEAEYDIDVEQDPVTEKWYHGRRDKSTGVLTRDRLATPAEITDKVTGPQKEPTPQYVERIENIGGVDKLVKKEIISGKSFIAGDATEEDKRRIITGKEAAPTLKFEYKNIKGVPHERQMEWNSATKQWIPKGDWIRKEKPEGIKAGEKLTMSDVKSAYSMDVGNIKNQMMIEMTPDEQANLAGQPTENILALLLAGRAGKSLSPERKKLYIDKLQEVETYYGDLTNQVLGRKGAKIPQMSLGPTPELAVSHGQPKELPAGSKLIGKHKKTGNPVYQLPDGTTKELRP